MSNLMTQHNYNKSPNATNTTNYHVLNLCIQIIFILYNRLKNATRAAINCEGRVINVSCELTTSKILCQYNGLVYDENICTSSAIVIMQPQ